jgi:hypothetical protein
MPAPLQNLRETRATQGEPLDDLAIHRSATADRRLSLQVKGSLTVSATASNTDLSGDR